MQGRLDLLKRFKAGHLGLEHCDKPIIVLSLLDQDLHLRRELPLHFTDLSLQCLVSGLACLVLCLQDLKLLLLLL